MRNPRQDEIDRDGYELFGDEENSIDRLNESIEEPNRKAGVKCKCGSVNTVWISSGGYQDADASRGMPIIETNGEIACNDCGLTWWD